MSKILKVFRVATDTKVENRSKFTFLVFFFLTRTMSFFLRKFPKSIGKLLKKLFSYLPRYEFVIKNSIGKWSVHPFNDGMTISSDYFEEGLKIWLSKPGSKRTFIDIGANIGRYSIIAANTFAYEKILSIEANPVTFAFLKKNIELNGIKALLKQTAVGDTKGTVTMQADSDHLGGGHIADYQNHTRSMDIQVEVPLTTVDTVCTESGIDMSQVDFIKIDVEGMEELVLRGMGELLRAMPSDSYIMVEITRSEAAVLGLLKEFGFDLLETQNEDNLFVKR